MAATAQSIGRLLSNYFPANKQGVRPLRARRERDRVWVYVSDPFTRKYGGPQILDSAAQFLREKGYSVARVKDVDLSFIVY
jgi:hypothetical protein